MQIAKVEASPDSSLKPPPSLHTLPSELRKLIVSYLAPRPYSLLPGGKQHLKNANATHSCLREWVPEYMFRDMILNHVLVGMSSQLERFAIEPSNSELLKFVKHIRVQVNTRYLLPQLRLPPKVPPALRWEVGMDEGIFGVHVEEVTCRRMCAKFRLSDERQMTDEQLEYCTEYYRAMVEPFTDNRTWYRLQRCAIPLWRKVFSYFPHLTQISAGCCQIEDHPQPTSTSTFVSKHGKDVIEEPKPRFVEDESVNMSWASSLIIRAAPEHVKSLRLSMVNLDNFNSFATVNRLQSLSYRKPLDNHVLNLTRLTLDVRGLAGTHGSKDWSGETGTAGAVKHWKGMLNSIRKLQHLELRDATSAFRGASFSHSELSDKDECLMDWLLPDLDLIGLQSLRLYGFVLDVATIQATLAGHWSSLEKLTLSHVRLLMRASPTGPVADKVGEHLKGGSWLETCRALHRDHPRWYIVLDQPSSIADTSWYSEVYLHPEYIKPLQDMANVSLEDFEGF